MSAKEMVVGGGLAGKGFRPSYFSFFLLKGREMGLCGIFFFICGPLKILKGFKNGCIAKFLIFLRLKVKDGYTFIIDFHIYRGVSSTETIVLFGLMDAYENKE